MSTKKCLSALKVICGRTGVDSADDEDPEEERALFDTTEEDSTSRTFYWSQALQTEFQGRAQKVSYLGSIDYISDFSLQRLVIIGMLHPAGLFLFRLTTLAQTTSCLIPMEEPITGWSTTVKEIMRGRLLTPPLVPPQTHACH